MFYVMKKPLGQEQHVVHAGTQKACEAHLLGYMEASVRYGQFKKEAITFIERDANPQIDLDYPHVRLTHLTSSYMTFDLYVIKLKV